MKTTKVKQKILQSFIENIACISDKKYQERVWVNALGPECDDIDDTVCDFFDDGDPILEKYKEFGITENQYDLLMILQKKLRIFTNSTGLYSPEKSTKALIKEPEWKEIMKTAKEVLEAFNYKKP
ncbi:MAG: hypothetical protein KFB93_00150 [Simkaniaceae bacterium]|nr:MAG: hypothetical protein KFB93_00150 [Simkaniaceae bacterium]